MKSARESSPIRPIEAILAGRIGLDPSSVSPNLVARGVRARMDALKIDDMRAYEASLRASPAEVQELIEEVVIPESWFFRDDRPYGFLRDFARDRLAGSPRRPPLRILSLPCARGEEPLSVAMALRDAGIDPGRFRIDGVDVANRNLEFARRGLYSTNAFRGADLGFRARYFQPKGAAYQADATLLGSIRYIRASVLDPDLLAGEPPYDIILCRNLLIYLTAEAKARTLGVLERLLAEDGILLVGHADSLGASALAGRPGLSTFASIGDPACFAFGKARCPAKTADAAPPRGSARRPEPEPDAEEAEFRFAEVVPPGRADPPSSPPISTTPAPPLLDQAGELANLGRHDDAIRLIDKQLQLKGPNAAAFHLMGVISQAAGDRTRAESCFNKAVYLDPHHDEALLALALLAERRGDASAASGYRRRAERAVASKGVS